jgi:mRNA-degrading endonuclease toxin of MazEF toxin-antitoxin module
VATQAEPQFRRGAVVIVAQVLDQAGRAPKDRPVVLVQSSDEVPEGTPLLGVAVTTTLPRALTPEFVRLRWARGGHVQTGLNAPNAAVCPWVVLVPRDAILRQIGVVSHRELASILQNLPSP